MLSFEHRRPLLFCFLLLACGDDDLADDAGPDASADVALTDAAQVDARLSDAAADSSPDAPVDVGQDATLDAADAGPVFVGDPPGEMTYRATNDMHFTLLEDDDDYTEFSIESARVQVLPLRDENFPSDVNYCRAASDDELNGLQQFARARLRPLAQSWIYDVTLETVAESDGESVYQLVVNGEVLAESPNPPTASTDGLDDMDSFEHTWNDIVLLETDEVEVRAKAHSNLTLLEGAACRIWDDTYAWARGRWVSLRLTAAEVP